MDVNMTFIDAVIAGDAIPDQLDDWIEAWHGGGGRGLFLTEYLGLTRAEYAAWAECRATEGETVLAAIARRRAEPRPLSKPTSPPDGSATEST